jgi:hypothetical protein
MARYAKLYDCDLPERILALVEPDNGLRFTKEELVSLIYGEPLEVAFLEFYDLSRWACKVSKMPPGTVLCCRHHAVQPPDIRVKKNEGFSKLVGEDFRGSVLLLTKDMCPEEGLMCLAPCICISTK